MDSFNRRSSKGASLASVYRLDTGLVQNAPNASLNPELWMLSSCRRLVFDAVPYTNLHSKQLWAGLCHGRGFIFLAGPLTHFPQCHNGLAPCRSGRMCFCRSMPRGGSWYDKWEGFMYLRLQSPASKTSSPSRIQHRALQDPYADNSPVPL